MYVRKPVHVQRDAQVRGAVQSQDHKSDHVVQSQVVRGDGACGVRLNTNSNSDGFKSALDRLDEEWRKSGVSC